MKKALVIFPFVVSVFTGLGGIGQAAVRQQDVPLASRGGLLFFVDTAGFWGDEGHTMQEIYVLIDAKQLQFVPEEGAHVAQMDISVAIRDSTGAQVEAEVWTRNVSLQNIEGLRESNAPFRDMIGFRLLPGAYTMTATIDDIFGDKQGSCDGPLEVKAFEVESLVTSDILTALKIEPAAGPGRFVRQGWKVIPNARRSYLAGNPLRFYFEIYNLSFDPDREGDTLILGYSLADSSGHYVKQYPAKRLIKPGQSIVKTDTLSTEGVEAGDYYLQVEVFDRKSRQHVRNRRRVFLAGGEVEVPQAQREQEARMIRHYMDVRYVAVGGDLKIYKNLVSQDSKMKFLKAFWRKLDPTPDTPTNERLMEHIRRMRHAEDHFFGGHGKRGSDTDKGRVYIKHGPPDDVTYGTSASGRKPYEIWTLEQRGRTQFIFRDQRGLGVFELVHSTHPGEVYNPGWDAAWEPPPPVIRGRRR